MMRVLVACESSGVVREAFRAKGHEAYSCDLLPSDDGSPHHLQSDAIRILWDTDRGWDLAICHPPCTYLSVSGLHWNGRVEGRAEKTEAALDFVRAMMAAPIDRIAIENPVSCISTRIRKPDQTIHPYQFGHNASKRTCLWLKNLPRLVPTKYVEPRIVGGKPRWANQTDGGQNNVGPSEDRWKIRSKTYQGVADAMSSQWSNAPFQEELF